VYQDGLIYTFFSNGALDDDASFKDSFQENQSVSDIIDDTKD